MPRIKKFGRRKYSSNQHKKSKSTEELLLNSVESASRRKIKIPDLLKEQDSQNVNIIVELDLLSSLMKNLLCCKYCCSSEKIELREDLKSRRGLAVSLEIICHNCGESTSTMSSKISNKCYDVNLRLTYGMRAIGKGGAAARIFCGLMNLPPPPAKFERHNSLFLNVLKTISEDSMNAAVHEAVIANDNNSNIAVAVDGTWHKRGYSSLNGVVCATSVENGKVIDFEALTKYCSSCKGKKKPCENCAKNYEGFSGGMECRGVLSIFQRSETSRKACYTQYLGDGDSKGFLTIKEAKVYGDTEVEKLECVGHVQKRMGTRLRNILKMSKGIKLSDGKNISRRGRLTLKEVDSIQHYYGLAIRKNLSSVEDMKRAIWAIYFHKLCTEDNPQHSLEKDLLKKCLHGRTQNPNESFNKCIWERIPKTVFVGIETLKFGVMDAVICFNDGYVSRIKVFEALGIKPGYNTERALLIIDNKRIFEAERIFGLAIHQNDHQARRRFVEWAPNEIAVVPDFHKRILFSDEAHFWLNGYVNKQNCRIWSKANPQVYAETALHPEKLTVWCALWAGGIIGPYFFKNDEGHNVTVNGDRYRAMITNFFIPELNNYDVQELWFQQDGATCHTARATIDLLKDTFGNRLISRFGPVNWPPRSCDLTPLNYFLWVYVKSLVYADKPQTLDHLEDNIRRVIADIRPQMLEKVIENWTSRLDYIRASRGSPMPEIIFKM
ncbi:uncharacterized protein TNCV_708681 [Trichonephila clavipes]|nr:uncharacterized protein TNCV_708681 [Trichonephila clavipes]